MSILLDTNLLLRLEDAGHSQHDLAKSAVKSVTNHGCECLLVPQVLYEFWVVTTRPIEVNGLGYEPAYTDQVISDWLDIFRILLDERGILHRWRELVAQHQVRGKTAHDARLVAAMQRHGVTNLLTFNGADFARFATISVYSPAEILAGRLPV